MADLRIICEQAARLGGKVLLDMAGQVGFRAKGINDLVTEADLQSQQAISKYLRAEVSEEAVIMGEEDQHPFVHPVQHDALVWLVDPLDGTTNYIHHFPHYCVSIAVTRRQELLAAAIFDPCMDECFTASRGDGATLNGNAIQPSQSTSLAQALVAASLPAAFNRTCPELERFLRACESTRSVRRTGSAALNLCYVACGRLDAYWATTLKPWDAAGGVLLVREAGGHVSDLIGEPFQVFQPDVLSRRYARTVQTAATAPLRTSIVPDCPFHGSDDATLGRTSRPVVRPTPLHVCSASGAYGCLGWSERVFMDIKRVLGWLNRCEKYPTQVRVKHHVRSKWLAPLAMIGSWRSVRPHSCSDSSKPPVLPGSRHPSKTSYATMWRNSPTKSPRICTEM